MIDWTQFPPPLPLEKIFMLESQARIGHELGNYCFFKKVRFARALTEAEATFECMERMGSIIASDGFLSLFHQEFTAESYAVVYDALTEVGGLKLRDLLCDAWDIYTNGKAPISTSELRSISVRRFNTREKMDLFNQIGEEVVAEIQTQYRCEKVWSVEYAKLHRAEFEETTS